jgi:hypothetical protein
VAEAVVDPLEAVHVEEVDGGGLGPPPALDRVAQTVAEEGAVRQPGERVVQREALELGLHALAVGHVEEDAEEERGLVAVVAAHDRHLVADPDDGAVGPADPVLLDERLAGARALGLVRDHPVGILRVQQAVP